MKTERVIWGLIFLFIGGVLLLDNFGTIDFHWGVLWRFWPLVLIILGVNMLFPSDDSNKGGMISVVITIAALVFIGVQGTKPDRDNDSGFYWDHKRSDDNDEENAEEEDAQGNTFSESISATTKYAVLNIEGGATKYELKDTTGELFVAEVKRRGTNFSLLKTSSDSTDNLSFSMSGKHKLEGRSGAGKAELKLNTKPIWDLNLEIGAGKIDFDLSPFKIKSIKLQGGAAAFDMKLGAPQQITTIDTDTGVSKLTISIPEGASCEIHSDTGLSSNEFDGFEKREDGTYVTPAYDPAKPHFVINISGGLSKARVERY
ncbi:LiaF transmembrane domain-containing protein [Desertivirga arenae]|uniref:LiaF transmembrane domain-containing protein n=1 Tax=Desertivirga arenae TaxID=2810309 RepID=UPI001A979A6E|nr:DUF5668 domain-containing protein [Pedobacter sp. SYSU D00823]